MKESCMPISGIPGHVTVIQETKNRKTVSKIFESLNPTTGRLGKLEIQTQLGL